MSTFAPDWAWDMLDIAPGTDQRGIKRAYSRLLKLNRPEDDAEAFQAIHQAYQAALAYADESQREQAVEPEPAADDRSPSAVSLIKPAPTPQAFIFDDPHAQAQRLWQRFLDMPEHLINERMALLDDDAALEGFATRDAVEVLALRLAADPMCLPRLRVRLAEHFKWENGMAHLERSEPGLAAMTATQLRADHGLEALQAQQAYDEVVPFLLAPTVPEGLGRKGDRGFHRAMRARIDSLRWQYPEVIEHRLVPEVFASWENYVATQKYFVQTGISSFAVGVVLFFLVQWPLTLSATALGVLFVACVGASVGGVALLVLRPPHAPLAAYAALRRDHLDAILHEQRYEPRWQHGWLAGFAALAPLLALNDPGAPMQALVSAGLTGCAALSVFAASAAIAARRIWLGLLVAAIFGFIMQHSGFDRFGYACYPFAVCLSLLALQSGAPLYATLGLTEHRLLAARVGWLAGLGLFYVGAGPLALPVIAMLSMLLMVAGAVLARAKFRAIITWPAIIVIKIGVFSHNGGGTVLSALPPQAAFLAGVLTIFAIFMFVNMFTDETD